MNILAHLFEFETKNYKISQKILLLKEMTNKLINNNNNNDNIYNPYINLILSLQSSMNKFITNLIANIFETADEEYKNSPERKEKYYINKSNVERCIVTIFGEVRFKRTLYKEKNSGEYFFYVDNYFDLEPYTTYDAIVRGICVDNSVNINPSNTSYHSPLNVLDLNFYINNNINKIPKQTIYRFKRNTKIRKVEYDFIPNEKTLYVMVDEKWIHKQDKNNPNTRKYIMAKCFVIFTGIERKGKRSRLIGKHTFITSSDTPWKDLMQELPNIYDFENIETINLLSDAGSWILSGAYELKLYSNNKLVINTCEFHVKQKINRSTTDKELRQKIADIIYNNEDKKAFIEEMDKLIESKKTPERQAKVTEYKNYILKHWKGIINMKYSLCKSSMEAHIQHCVASSFSSVPKAYSSNNIETYLKLQELSLNGINIFNYYLKTFNSPDDFIYNNNEKEVSFSIFERPTSNIPIVTSSNHPSIAINSIAFPNL